MKIINSNKIQYQPASHEDPKSPGALKKVLLTKTDLQPGMVQMINWAKIPKGKSFAGHYHEDMQEIFIIISGKVKVVVEGKKKMIGKGDLVLVPANKVHVMKNLSDHDVEYIAIGISEGKDGKTVVV